MKGIKGGHLHLQSGHLIPINQSCQDESGSTRISTGVGDHPCFLTYYNYSMNPIDCIMINNLFFFIASVSDQLSTT